MAEAGAAALGGSSDAGLVGLPDSFDDPSGDRGATGGIFGGKCEEQRNASAEPAMGQPAAVGEPSRLGGLSGGVVPFMRSKGEESPSRQSV